MVDFQYELIAQYYSIYSPLLWLLYFAIVVRIFTKTRESHFSNLIAMNGISDLTLCLLGNFFYRWPRNGVFHESVYQHLQTYSTLLTFLYYLLFHLPYAEFLSTLFMAFNSFTSLVIPKYYMLFWRNCFYKYALVFILFPIALFCNVLLSESRFHYVPNTQQYLLFTASTLPQYMSRETGTAILTTFLALTALLFILCFIMISGRLFREFEQKLERYQLEEMFIGIFYTLLRSVFLYYELMINSYTEAKDRTAIYRAGNLFPFINDIITLLPPIFLIAVSSQIRHLIIPFFGHKKNRVHFDERANEVRSGGYDEEEIKEEPADTVDKIEEENQNEKHEEIINNSIAKNHVEESDVQKIIGQSLGDTDLYPGYHDVRRMSEIDEMERGRDGIEVNSSIKDEINETIKNEIEVKENLSIKEGENEATNSNIEPTRVKTPIKEDENEATSSNVEPDRVKTPNIGKVEEKDKKSED